MTTTFTVQIWTRRHFGTTHKFVLLKLLLFLRFLWFTCDYSINSFDIFCTGTDTLH
jgi:hypothetical protein